MKQRETLSLGVIACLALAVLLNYVDRGNLATAAPLVQDELGLSSAQIGLLLQAPVPPGGGWACRTSRASSPASLPRS